MFGISLDLQGVLTMMKIALRMTIVATSVFAFFTVFMMLTSVMMAGVNQGALSDIIAIVQMWLPFDIGSIFAWMFTVVFAFLSYKTSVIGLAFLNRVLGWQ